MIRGRLVRSLESVIAALRRAVGAKVEDINRLLGHVLRGGVLLSVSILVVGFAVAFLEGSPLPRSSDLPPQVLSDALHLRPVGLLNLGILVMISTPVARVALSIASFAKERDARFAAITSIVLFNLVLGLALGVV